jgi:hypothetical protein
VLKSIFVFPETVEPLSGIQRLFLYDTGFRVFARNDETMPTVYIEIIHCQKRQRPSKRALLVVHK